MKKAFPLILSLLLILTAVPASFTEETAGTRILVQGHASLRITTAEGKVIYIDPYAGDGYDVPADLILLTHSHNDHTATKKIKNKNKGCQTITWKEALKKGVHQSFDLDWVQIEAVEAGNNKNHSIKKCVGYILTFTDGKTLYVSGDTSTTDQMAALAERHLNCAFFCCDGTYNMDLKEALACADLVGAAVSVPYHPTAEDKLFDAWRDRLPENIRLIPAGEEFVLE